MNEIYWITVLGNVKTLLAILFSLFCLYVCITLVCSLADSYDSDEFVENINKFKLKLIIPLCIVLSLSICFIPNTKQLYMMFGIGSIVDYVQESDEVKKLPDKTIQVLNKWCDEHLSDK